MLVDGRGMIMLRVCVCACVCVYVCACVCVCVYVCIGLDIERGIIRVLCPVHVSVVDMCWVMMLSCVCIRDLTDTLDWRKVMYYYTGIQYMTCAVWRQAEDSQMSPSTSQCVMHVCGGPHVCGSICQPVIDTLCHITNTYALLSGWLNVLTGNGSVGSAGYDDIDDVAYPTGIIASVVHSLQATHVCWNRCTARYST